MVSPPAENRWGLRVSELVHLQWSAVEFESATLHVGRSKGGTDGTHYLAGNEMRVLRALRRESQGTFLFVSERGVPFIRPGSQNSWSESAKPPRCPLRSTRTNCGMPAVLAWPIAVSIREVGHQSISSTTRYAALAPGRFKNLWH